MCVRVNTCVVQNILLNHPSQQKVESALNTCLTCNPLAILFYLSMNVLMILPNQNRKTHSQTG